MQLFTDNPINSIEEDLFGFGRYAEELKDIILQTTSLPFCVGIFSPWGSGKSSFMKMLQGLMDGEAGIKTLWFNPWKYDAKEDIWNALIQTLVNYLLENSRTLPLASQQAFWQLRRVP